MEIQDKRYGDFFGSSDLGDATDGAGRLGAVAGAPDDPLPHAEGEERFGQARHQAYDALRDHAPPSSALHLFEDLLRRRDRVELPVIHPLHELGVLPVEALLHLAFETDGGPGDHKLPLCGPPSLFQLTALLQVCPVLLYRLLELLDAFSRVSAGHKDRRGPGLRFELFSYIQDLTHLVRRPVGLWMVALVDAEDVRDLHHPGFQGLHRVPRPRLQDEHHRVRRGRNLDLSLSYTHGLVDHHVHPVGLHRQPGELRPARQAPEVSAAPHRADKHPRVEEVLRQAYAVAEDRSFRERARRVNRDDAHLLILLAVELYELGDDAALAHAGRPGKAHAEGRTRMRIELGDDVRRLRVFAFDLRDYPGQR